MVAVSNKPPESVAVTYIFINNNINAINKLYINSKLFIILVHFLTLTI